LLLKQRAARAPATGTPPQVPLDLLAQI